MIVSPPRPSVMLKDESLHLTAQRIKESLEEQRPSLQYG